MRIGLIPPLEIVGGPPTASAGTAEVRCCLISIHRNSARLARRDVRDAALVYGNCHVDPDHQ